MTDMEQEGHEAQPSPIEGLSVELIQMILSAIPDIATLQTAVFSCSLFYRPFQEAEKIIVTDVLLNQVDTSVLPEAIAAYESSLLCVHSPTREEYNAINDFVDRNLRQRRTLPQDWTLQTAPRLGQLPACVKALAKTFATTALRKRPRSCSAPVATRQEMHRIERALYRFETYCNLFRDSPRAESHLYIRSGQINFRWHALYHEPPRAQSRLYVRQGEIFTQRASPWENEQLGCIHDFLARLVMPAFNDIAEHDIAWGLFRVDHGDDMGSPFIQHILSLGLEKIYQISEAETYDERYRLLNAWDPPPTSNGFLQMQLKESGNDDDLWIEDLGLENSGSSALRPFFADPDPGPVDAWLWSRRSTQFSGFLGYPDWESLRHWGYVMWDRSRLDADCILRESWETVVDPGYLHIDIEDRIRRRTYKESSWSAREEIYLRGGSGWWSWGNHSKVRWVKSRTKSGQGPVFDAPAPDSLEGVPVLLNTSRRYSVSLGYPMGGT